MSYIYVMGMLTGCKPMTYAFRSGQSSAALRNALKCLGPWKTVSEE